MPTERQNGGANGLQNFAAMHKFCAARLIEWRLPAAASIIVKAHSRPCLHKDFLFRTITYASYRTPCRFIFTQCRRHHADNCQNIVNHVLTTLSALFQTQVAHKFYNRKTRSGGGTARAGDVPGGGPQPKTNSSKYGAHERGHPCPCTGHLQHALLCWTWCHPTGNKEGPAPSVPPAATSASTTGRRAPKRDTRSHREVARSQQAGQRPARRNIGWHLMPMY
ncbi:hypothetical protein XTPLMG728_3648 [Xanthomonas translucens pv. poae]|uniref:Uncharacterized protein n=1 Tax=Xanthomonas graminis pv. poae TaxID=227946 RepID=A0A0K3A608_9XANT|nr:hypothetical protein XTPLMG728_3648 [Xanthomonas translucens pv. poae]